MSPNIVKNLTLILSKKIVLFKLNSCMLLLGLVLLLAKMSFGCRQMHTGLVPFFYNIIVTSFLQDTKGLCTEKVFPKWGFLFYQSAESYFIGSCNPRILWDNILFLLFSNKK